ncbi:Serine/threonine-protein kinase PknD [Methylobacterium cerastii]|uniref:Serine/threonine-protein kinase PknD n=1 Tax=Methylobacterium cerastii TaxID=932741 RepID=A0ABQ4QLH8_9HYPH|nr:serine/threonine-protein kinase [Methylobacterium cerastii]GJD45619.1 Serine/threonine-protein kinase PknD [Methylobacterium cerastii]
MTEETRISPGPQFRLGPGTRLNGIYEIERFITAGGMGEIYRGRAIETGDTVAIKTIRPDLAGVSTAMQLFRKEASALHNLYHEAIVRYFVFSTDPGLSLTYLAMEFVEGESLSELAARGPLSTQQLRTLTHRLASGLQAAHRLGIIHRDLSPDNILVPGGDVTNAKIIDFGIARSTLGEGTVIGSGFAGKMNYVSPEQLGLFGGEVGPPSDIYSLGLVIAEAARGRHLDMGHSHVEVIDRRRRVPDLAGIDPAIRAVLTRMLQPNPKDRPQSMGDVETWMPRAEPRPGSGRGRRVAAAATGVVLLVGLGAAAFYAGGLDFAGLSPGGVREAATPSRLAEPDPLPPPPQRPLSEPKLRQETRQESRQETQQETRQDVRPEPRLEAQSELRQEARQERAPLQSPGPVAALESPALSPPPEAPATPFSPRPGVSVEQVREFLRGYGGGKCFHITPVTVAAREATIEAYGATPTPFMAFDEAFQRILGFEPEINLRQVTAAQCPLVEYLGSRANQRVANRPMLTLKSDTLRGGDDLVASTDVRADKHVDLLLISNDGLVHSLTGYTKRSGDTLTATLKLVDDGRGGDPTPQLVVALASPKPLTALLAEAKSGTMTAERFVKLLPSEAVLTVKYVKLGS